MAIDTSREAVERFIANVDHIAGVHQNEDPDEMAALLRALLDQRDAARKGAGSDWQPIETAPRDEAVLVWTGSSVKIAVVWYNSGNLATIEGAATDDVWGPSDYEGPTFPERPIHWMPLPAPPENAP